ncbi:hypothetical protein [Paenibacillus elgii]|uniref:hypothetical protein n=1 Tax=Paenibacillus elgii TaxID=189691 RepID=UPI00203D79E7|nr:hypothetical protein [Paenibacillus elgii]MCM3269660.1 hypothetical protein [Paenibacillus elgii]
MNNNYPTYYNNPLITSHPPLGAAKKGNYFITTTGTQTIANNNFLSFQLSNNAKQNIYVSFITVTFITQARNTNNQFTQFELFKNPTTFTTVGTAATIWNAIFSLADGFAGITAKFDPVNNQFAGLSPISTYNQDIGTTIIDFLGSIILAPGNTLGVHINNSSTFSNNTGQAYKNYRLDLLNFWKFSSVKIFLMCGSEYNCLLVDK